MTELHSSTAMPTAAEAADSTAECTLLPTSAAFCEVVGAVQPVTLVPMVISAAQEFPNPQTPHQAASSDGCVAFSLLMGQLTVETEGVPPILQVTVPALPAAIVAWPLKSQVSGVTEAHLGGLVIQAHLAETLLMPACKKRNGSMFASTAPKRVAEILRMMAMMKHSVSAELERTGRLLQGCSKEPKVGAKISRRAFLNTSIQKS